MDRRRASAADGFSLIEMMIVVVIIGLAMGVVALGVGATSQARLRSSCWTLATAARYAYSRAVTQGTTVRIVLDFGKRSLWLEETAGRVVLSRDDESGSGLQREGLEYLGDGGVENASLSTRMDMIGAGIGEIGGSGGVADALGGMAGSGGGDMLGGMMQGLMGGGVTDPFLAAMQGTGGALSGSPAGYRGARFERLTGRAGEVRELEGGTAFVKAYTPHEPQPRDEGRAYIYFFPGGTTEHSVIQLTDGDERVYAVEVHPLNGRAIIHRFGFEPEGDLDELQEARE
ncbi:MAG TPA: prepilin-type N-terminal cleavage/methylation domain-containing protein [Polyangia bacterium]|nr:prepilin-type N-terminal cleavage/methylation domain-containing protein [Polyangia bacterium]